MDKSAQRKAGAALSYVTIIVNTLIQLLYTPLLIRMLGQSEYGLFSLVSSIIGYLTVLDLGFGNAIIVYTSKYRAKGKIDEEKKLHGMFKVVFIIIGIITAILGLILYFNVNNIFGSTMTPNELYKMKIMMLILAFNLMITFSFSIYSSIISAYEKFVFQKVMALLNSILKPLIMVPLLFLGYKSITMCIVITIVNILIIMSNYIYCKRKLKVSIKYLGFDKKLFKTVLGYSIWIFMGVIVDKVNWSVDNFVLGAVSGTIAVSIYSAASTINQLFIQLSTAVSSVLLPKMSKMVAKKATNEEITNEFIKVGRIQYYIIFLMCSGLILFGKDFFVAWVGRDFVESYYVAIILIVPLCIPLIQNLGISIRQAMNKHKFSAIVNIIIAVLNIACSIPLAIKFGAIGASIGTGVGILLSSIINNIYYYKELKIDIIKFWKNIIKMSCFFIIPIIAVVLFKNMVMLQGYKSLIVYGSFYSIIYIGICIVFVLDVYEKTMLKKFFERVFRRRAK